MSTMKTRFGRIFYGAGCKDDWPNITNYRQRRTWSLVRLQRPAIRSLKSAERAFQWQTRRRPGRRPIRTTGSHRTCAFQASKYREDPKTFAPPGVGVHTDGLAIDVYWGDYYTPREKDIIRQILRRRGWHQSRPVEEGWHFSYGVTA